MTRICLIVALVFGAWTAGLSAKAANLFWEGRTVESIGAFDSNWDVGGAVNWNLNTEAGTLVSFANGDNVTFKDDGGGNNDNPNVVIAAGGVSPGTITFNRGFGFTYNISGGDILTGSMFGIRDDTKNFTRNGSYSFSGGTSITAGGSNFNYAPTSSGTYNFGTGTITLSAGTFNFNPAAASTLTNNFVLNGGTITGNGNATFSGNLTIGGSLINLTSGTFPFPALTITQNTTIETTRCCGPAPVSQLTADILGTGTHNITLQGSLTANADWQSRIDAPVNGWNVKDIAKTGRTLMFLNGSLDKFFDGMVANGGKFYHRGGSIRFTSATPNIDFALMMDPAPAMLGVNPFETGSGFNTTTQLNIVSGGLLGGNGTVAADNNLNGGLPTFESNVNVVVNNGGEIAPGLSVGLLTIKGNLTMNGGSLLTIEIDGTGAVAGTDYDQLAVAGAVALNGAELFIDIDEDLRFLDLTGNSYRILTAANDLSGASFGGVEFSSVAGGSWSADLVYGNGFVDITNLAFTVPEPSTGMLLGLGAIAMSWRVRRRKN